jgi:hypothetical protein
MLGRRYSREAGMSPRFFGLTEVEGMMRQAKAGRI